ncbi:MAG: hypothetical protein K9G60_09505 [Pseudolabrys sp.]|nr:hypothetical protein [Pseudolabrys sp.]
MAVQVHRRLIIYVQGYDPRGLPEYYRMFRREYRRSLDLYGLTGTIGRIEHDAERFCTHWDVTTAGDDWRVETRYQFLRWDDIIRQDFVRPPWWKIVHMYRSMLVSIANGVVARIIRAHWRFGLFILYPLVLMTAFLLLGVATGAAAMALLDLLGAPTPLAAVVGALAGFSLFAGLLRLTESKTYLLYLCDDIVATHEYALRQRPDWDARMEQFALHVAEAVRGSNADEAIVVGHSSGSFLAVDVLDRALTHDTALGRHGPRVRLLTLGANLPIVGFHRPAQWFRDKLKRLALSPQIDWVDYQSRHDIMNFWPFDPVAGHGIELGAERRNPLVVAISFRDLWPPESFSRRRWRFFRAHFQFLHANERLGAAYDYYLICCGPADLMDRATRPAEVATAMMPELTSKAPVSGSTSPDP